VTAEVLWIADSICHRPLPIRIPSLYGPVARLAFHPSRTARRAFRFWFSKLYRKRVWNPTMGAVVKTKGFDRNRHLQAANMHAACSELVFNAPAIVLSRYLYRLTFRKRGLTDTSTAGS